MAGRVWEHLFDDQILHGLEATARKTTKEVAQVRRDTEWNLEDQGALRAENASLRQRLERQELLLQTLLDWHVAQKHFDSETFGVLVARADLADGIEDGVLSPTRAQNAPTCARCDRPVNPKRKVCVFCGSTEKNEAKTAPSRNVKCAKCLTPTPEAQTYYSGVGLVCGNCFHG